MIIQNNREESLITEAAKISVEILSKLGDMVKEGVTPLEIDEYAGELCREYKVHPSFKRVKDYYHNTCISVNDVAVHGIPNDIPLKKGDLVSIDFGIVYKKMYTDHCWTWCIGKADEEKMKLLQAGRNAVENAIPQAVAGNRTGDLGYEMEKEAKRNGFNVLSVYVGHGVGKSLHEDPEIPAFGKRGTGSLLEDGMVICIECQVVDDVDGVHIDEDDWSARTVNGGNAVMFEYMVIVRKDSPTILTNTLSWGVEKV
ncbi:TPA: type I methionyl aminopeptidase [Candidatus Dojkabacteria bacterium]|uniref:Methionine aminopeptidase n=1 Tax=Candidatus Dojkabacteria bacterium TaxID=2099670 RepID=A0A832Q7Z3_9BACT|nr:type I methionyl aminopeptidase [Candidatus Dojkabacteria bacterium]